MKVGIGIVPQNYRDWGRYTAEDWEAQYQVPDASIYADALTLARLAEDVGLDSVWTVEHHFTPYIIVPNPVQFLTYIAGATSRMDVGSMVSVLPWHHPLRLAAEVAVLDIILGPERRFHMGTGRGTAKTEFDAFGIDRNSTRSRYAEVLEVLRLALSQERFSFKGEHFDIPEVTVRPRPPSQRVLDDMLMAWGSAESLPIAANAGLKPMFIPQKSWADLADEIRQFNAIRAEHGWDPVGATAAVWMYCAPTRAEAEEQGRQYSMEYSNSTRLHYMLDKPEVFREVRDYDRYVQRATAMADEIGRGTDPAEAALRTSSSLHVIGSPEDCRDQLMDICQSLGVEHLVCVFQFGTMPTEHAQRSVRLFAEQVVPELQQLSLMAAV